MVLFGSPTRYGNVAGRLKVFIDSLGGPWSQGLLADKVYAGFTSSQTAHGGQETTLLALYNTIHHFGGLIVSPGYTDGSKFVDGNPYGVSHVTGANNDAPIDETVTTRPSTTWSPGPSPSARSSPPERSPAWAEHVVVDRVLGRRGVTAPQHPPSQHPRRSTGWPG